MGKYSFSLFLSVIVLIAVTILFGQYYENSEAYAAELANGHILSPPVHAWFKDAWLLHIPLIIYLSEYFENTSVFGILHLLIFVLYLSGWLYLCIRMFSRLIRTKAVRVLIGLLLVFVLADTSLICVYNLREAILLSTSSLLLFLDYYIYRKQKSIPFQLAFLYACLIRINGVILVIIPVTLLVALNYKDIKKVLDLLKFQWITVILCFLLVVGGNKFVHGPGSKIEGNYEYALFDRQAQVPLSEMKTHVDSIRYEALTRYFLVMDSVKINIDFIDRVVDKKKFGHVWVTLDDVNHFFEDGLPVIRDHLLFIILLYIILGIALWGGPVINIGNIFLYNLACWAIVLFIGVKINIFEYFIDPWLAVIFGGSFWFISVQPEPLRVRQKACIFILLLLMFFIEISNLKTVSVEQHSKAVQSDLALKRIETLAGTSKPVLFSSKDIYFPRALFSRSKSIVLKKCVYMNLSFLAYYDWGQKQCLEQFGVSPTNWQGLGLAFIKNKEELTFIMPDGLATFIPVYYKNIYGINFQLVKDKDYGEIIPGNYVYRLQTQ